MKKGSERDEIPEHFISLEKAGEFWDSHDAADYDDLSSEVQFEAVLGNGRDAGELTHPTLRN